MTYDVAVVGAGPAGAWTAWSLATRGARVLLLDPSHPREKPCGGGITKRALDLIGDAIDVGRLPAVAIRSARIAATSYSRSAGVTLGDEALWVASRREFDGRLLDAARHAGAHFVATRVTDLRSIAGGFAIDAGAATYRTSWVVGADGANSLVRRRLGRPFGRHQLSIATGYFAHGASSDEIAIEFIGDPPGYLWAFPRPGHLAIGVCAQADAGVTATDLRRLAADWIARTPMASGARLEAYSWPIPSLTATDFESLQPGGPGWLLVGDAAGLVDPITREGIYFALLSAERAAGAITAGGPEGFHEYTNRIRDEIGVELAHAARLKERFFRPRFTRLFIEALRHSASVRAVLADLVAGRQGYGDLKWRLLKTLQLGLAARVLVAGIGRRMTGQPRFGS